MPLTEDQIAAFFRDGYVVCRGLADPATVAQVRALGERTFTEGGGGGEQRRWTPAIFDHDQPRQDAELHALLRDPAIYGAASQLLGGAPARVYYGMLAVVPPDGGTGLPWHSDNMYSHVLGGALNCFVALEEIGPEKGQLWIAPASHLRGVRPNHQAEAYGGHREALTPPSNQLQMPTLHAGDVVRPAQPTSCEQGRNRTLTMPCTGDLRPVHPPSERTQLGRQPALRLRLPIPVGPCAARRQRRAGPEADAGAGPGADPTRGWQQAVRCNVQ